MVLLPSCQWFMPSVGRRNSEGSSVWHLQSYCWHNCGRCTYRKCRRSVLMMAHLSWSEERCLLNRTTCACSVYRLLTARHDGSRAVRHDSPSSSCRPLRVNSSQSSAESRTYPSPCTLFFQSIIALQFQKLLEKLRLRNFAVNINGRVPKVKPVKVLSQMEISKTRSRIFNDKERAEALALYLTLNAIWFQFEPLPDGRCRISLRQSDATLLKKEPKRSYCFVCEGASSTEGFFLHAHPTFREARGDRRRLMRGAYRSSEIVEVSPLLNVLGERFYGITESFINMESDLSYSD